MSSLIGKTLSGIKSSTPVGLKRDLAAVVWCSPHGEWTSKTGVKAPGVLGYFVEGICL